MTRQYLVTYVGHLGKNKPKQYRKMAGALDQWQTVHDTALRWTKDLERQSVSQSVGGQRVLLRDYE